MEQPILKAFGRSLGDFSELYFAEKKLLEACQIGRDAFLSDKRPEQKTNQNVVRSEFLRFLALGGDENAPVHERGVNIQGAWIEGDLKIESVTLPHNLGLGNCYLSKVNLCHSNIHGSVMFKDCYIKEGITADGMNCKAGVFLEGLIVNNGSVRLINAFIGGNLQCQRAKIDGKGSDALVCDGAVIKGSVFFNDGFTAHTITHNSQNQR